MIIFQRTVTFDGAPPQEVVPWAMAVTERVNAVTSANVSLWQVMAGGPIGTLAWSTIQPSLTELEHHMDALATDPEYLELTGQAEGWISTPGEDHVLRIVHTAGGEYVRPEPGGYAEAMTAVPANGKLAAAGAFGVAMSDVHSQVTHSSVLFCAAEYGQYGEMRWVALYDSAAAVDDAAETIAKDPEYLSRIDEAGGLFTPGSSRRMLARRML